MKRFGRHTRFASNVVRRAVFFLMAGLFWLTVPVPRPEAQTTLPPSLEVLVVDVSGAIGVGTRFYLNEAFQQARNRDSALIVLRLDTPGGLVSATREIIQQILASPVPVVLYVAPNGARAASAGTYISYAAHVAAMAPGTHLGAATPVRISLPGAQPPASPGGKDDKTAKPAGGDAMENKILNDAIAGLRSLAQLRGRNAEWAEKAVRDASTLTASEALKLNVVDIVAANVPDLLHQIDGRTVQMARGPRVIRSANATISEFPMNWKAQFLSAITDPNIAFILLLVGFYGIVFEFLSPGLTGPGIVGAISLLLGLAALSMLPLNFAGVALLLLGLALMVAESFTPGFGILGTGGVAAFLLGGAFLFDPSGADIDFAVAWPVLISAALTSALLLILTAGFIIRTRRSPVRTGDESIAGSPGVVIEWQDGSGRVRMQGEIWRARSPSALTRGQNVVAQGRDGLVLIVQPQDREN